MSYSKRKQLGPAQFTVVIPLYNKQRYVGRAIESVLLQTLTNFRLVIVDDGSTDGSYEIAICYKDPRIRVIRQSNLGPGAARNAGIREAVGMWVAFLDADDFWYSDHLEELWRIRTECPDACLIATRLCHHHVEGRAISSRAVAKSTPRYIDYFAEAMSDTSIVSSSSAAINVVSVAERPLFAGFARAQDTACWVTLALRYKVAVSERTTAVYVRGTGGIQDTLSALGGVYNGSVSDLFDVSPPLGVAWPAVGTAPSELRKSVARYARQRTYRYIKRAVFANNIAGARSAARLAAAYSAEFKVVQVLLAVPLFGSHVMPFFGRLRRRLRR